MMIHHYLYFSHPRGYIKGSKVHFSDYLIDSMSWIGKGGAMAGQDRFYSFVPVQAGRQAQQKTVQRKSLIKNSVCAFLYYLSYCPN
jgi:hypothetical protein